MSENNKVQIAQQLRDIANIIGDEVTGMNEKLQTRFQLHQLFRDLLSNEEALRSLIEEEKTRQNYITVLGKAIDAEVEEFQRYKKRFDLIQGSLLLHATLITEGKQGIDF